MVFCDVQLEVLLPYFAKFMSEELMIKEQNNIGSSQEWERPPHNPVILQEAEVGSFEEGVRSRGEQAMIGEIQGKFAEFEFVQKREDCQDEI
ncbi:hypothetical protein AVEN_186076-1 [Araneus ventricosus]|uniref:Uncharacterized protein n=1 Tax=Araneus ventricosus TaxID=182803 RepID=A0A4Y2M5Q9_ARAVE|nr:hypothetical protein AVEN_186076-1 [Araneus ventricosus]